VLTMARLAVWGTSATVAAAVAWVYVASLHETVAGGDSGELVAQACGLGTAHPPGYPLLTMLAASFVRWAPGSTPAARANLVSAVCGALAAGVVSLAVCRLSLLVLNPPSRSSSPAKSTLGGFLQLACCCVGAAASAWLFATSATVWR